MRWLSRLCLALCLGVALASFGCDKIPNPRDGSTVVSESIAEAKANETYLCSLAPQKWHNAATAIPIEEAWLEKTMVWNGFSKMSTNQTTLRMRIRFNGVPATELLSGLASDKLSVGALFVENPPYRLIPENDFMLSQTFPEGTLLGDTLKIYLRASIDDHSKILDSCELYRIKSTN